MPKKKQPEQERTFSIPYEVTLRGDLVVEAKSAEEAMQIANGGGWDDDTFFNRAEIVNWKIRGAAKDCG